MLRVTYDSFYIENIKNEHFLGLLRGDHKEQKYIQLSSSSESISREIVVSAWQAAMTQVSIFIDICVKLAT